MNIPIFSLIHFEGCHGSVRCVMTLRPPCLLENILTTSQLKDTTSWTSCDNTSTFRSRMNHEFHWFKFQKPRVDSTIFEEPWWGVVFAELTAFRPRQRLWALPETKTNATFSITDDDSCTESELTTTTRDFVTRPTSRSTSSNSFDLFKSFTFATTTTIIATADYYHRDGHHVRHDHLMMHQFMMQQQRQRLPQMGQEFQESCIDIRQKKN